MPEIEVKVLDIDPGAVRAKLRELGAVQVKLGREVNSIFDFPDGRLHERGGYVRLRDFCGKTILTFKERLPGTEFKESVEHETSVGDAAAARAVLEALGLVLKRVDEKDRESYRLGAVLFELDHWPTFPTYLEVEAPSRDEVVEGLRQLGYRLQDSTGKRWHEIARDHYGRELPPSLRFEP